ncbi:unnamed protein product [Cunninghamella echinulata]
MGNSEDVSVIKKYEQLKRRVQDMEQDNSNIHTKLIRAQKHVKRLRMERLILLEQLDEYYTTNKDRIGSSDSEESDISDIGSMMTLNRKRKKNKRGRFNEKNGKKSSNGKINEATNPPVRKKKDPNAPKGPGNVFFLFCRMERENFKDELPTENLGEVTRLLGQKWKAMTDDEKKKYYDIYDKEQEEYRKAMKSYKDAGGGESGKIAVSKMNEDSKNGNDNFDEVDMLVEEQNVDDDDDDDDDDDVDDDDDDDDDDDVDEDDEEGEEDNGSFMDDVSVATTTLSSTIEPPMTTTHINSNNNDNDNDNDNDIGHSAHHEHTENMDINSDPIIEISSPTDMSTQ